MPITEETKTVARCDADSCTSVRFGSKEQPPVGFYATVERIQEDADGKVYGEKVELFACSLPHVKKAADDKLAGREGVVVNYPSLAEGESEGK